MAVRYSGTATFVRGLVSVFLMIAARFVCGRDVESMMFRLARDIPVQLLLKILIAKNVEKYGMMKTVNSDLAHDAEKSPNPRQKVSSMAQNAALRDYGQ